jgi:hypothetical protein
VRACLPYKAQSPCRMQPLQLTPNSLQLQPQLPASNFQNQNAPRASGGVLRSAEPPAALQGGGGCIVPQTSCNSAGPPAPARAPSPAVAPCSLSPLHQHHHQHHQRRRHCHQGSCCARIEKKCIRRKRTKRECSDWLLGFQRAAKIWTNSLQHGVNSTWLTERAV